MTRNLCSIAHFKGFGMINLQYEIRMCKKIIMKSQWHVIFGILFSESEFSNELEQSLGLAGQLARLMTISRQSLNFSN